MDLIRSRLIFSSFMLVVLVVLSVMLWWRYDASKEHYSSTQSRLMQSQAEHAAQGVEDLVNEIRFKMSAISVDELWLNDLAEFSDNVAIQESLAKRFKLFFPKMYSYVITDAHGEQIGGDYDFFIEQVCQQDIYHVARMFSPKVEYFEYEPYIHPKPSAYHFDVMMPVYALDKKMIFFMSFDAALLQLELAKQVITKHPMYLLRTDVKGLIEVSTQAVRDKLQRDNHLNDNELALIHSSVPVPNSKWRVVVLENTSLTDAFEAQLRVELVAIWIVLFLMWASVFWLGLHYEAQRGRLVAKLNHLSLHDELTGLANRRKLLSEIQFAQEDVRFRGEVSAILMLDLNDFKAVNDNLGHDAGDEVLQACAERLKLLTRSGDLVSRLGGDEFVVLLNGLGINQGSNHQAHKNLKEIVNKLRRQLTKPYQISQGEVSCPPSIGVQIINENDDAIDLLKKADEKMYADKQVTKR